MSYKVHFYMGKEKRLWFFFQIMSETVVLVRKFGIGNSWNHVVSSSYDLSFHKSKPVLQTLCRKTIDWPVFVVSELVVGSGEQDTFGKW